MRQDASDSRESAPDANLGNGVDGIGSDDRVQAILEQYLVAIESYGSVDRERFLKDHSDLADILTPHLDGIDMMLQVRGPVATEDSDASSPFDSYLRPLATLGDFRLIREIGRGGMGIVFEAEQLSMGRKVALKVLPFAAMVDRLAIKRFQNEVRATAALDHPNVVPVYWVGEERSVHFYAMQFIDGCPLSQAVKDLQSADSPDNGNDDGRCRTNDGGHNDLTDDGLTSTSLTTARSKSRPAYFRTVCELVIQAAEGLHHAHEQGIVHRDIKPGNLLLDNDGKLWISDFGLARVDFDGTGITMSGDVLGTLRYMSPEQAFGERAVVDRRTDIYSLGATLYELLTLRPIFAGHDRKSLLKQIAEKEPRSPSKFDSKISADLETIVLKALSKHPEDRYGTAKLFAQDLANSIERKPLIARPPGIFERANKWALRHPTFAVAVAAILLLVTLTATAGWIWSRHVNRLLTTSQASTTAALSREQLARQETSNAQRNAESLLYAADVRLAADGLKNGNVGAARKRLARHVPIQAAVDRRGFAWNYVWNELHPEEMVIEASDSVRDVCYSPDGSLIVAGVDSGRVTLWSAKTGHLIRELSQHHDTIRSLAFSTDGVTLASASDDGTVTLWNVVHGKVQIAFTAHPDGVEAVVFGPADSLITAGGKEVKVWRNGWDRPHATLGPHPDSVYGIAISPDGTQLAVASGTANTRRDGAVTLWDLDDSLESTVLYDSEKCVSVAYSHEGQWLVAGTQRGALVAWNVNDLSRPVARVNGHASNIYRVAFSADDQLVATASKDMTVRVWNTETWTSKSLLQSHSGRVYAADFSPGDHRLVTASSDKTIKFWNVARQSFALRECSSIAFQSSPAFSEDGRTCALLSSVSCLQLFSLQDRVSKSAPIFPAWDVAWSATSRLVVSSELGLFKEHERGVLPLNSHQSEADVDGDGDIDRVAGFGNRGNMIWQENRGDGSFRAARLRLPNPAARFGTRIADVHDKRKEEWWVLLDGQIGFNLHRRGRVEGEGIVVGDLADATAVGVADLTSDGSTDLVVATYDDGQLSLLPRRVDGTFPPIEQRMAIFCDLSGVSAISFADFDGDGKLDIAAAVRDSAEVVCLRNEGEGEFRLLQRLALSITPELLDMQDVNADGQLDIIAAGTEGIVCCYRKVDAFQNEQRKLETLEAANWTRPLSSNVAIFDVESRDIVHAFHSLDDSVGVASISPDGSRLVTVGKDHVLRFWDDQGTQLAAVAMGDTRVWSVLFTRDGSTLCAAAGDELWVYNTQDYQERYRCLGHQNTVISLCVSQDNQVIATGSEDLGIRLWSLDTGQLLHALVGHRAAPTCLVFSDDNHLLASGDDLGVVRIWDVGTGQELLELNDYPYRAKALAFTAPDSLAVVGNEWQQPGPGGRQVKIPTFLGQWSAGGIGTSNTRDTR